MKIAIVTETFLPYTDGIVTRLCATIRWLQRNGHTVRVIAPDLGVLEFEGAEVIGIPARAFFLYRHMNLALPSPKVKSALLAFQPDVVHVVNPAVLGVAGVYYARRLRLPLIASYHTQVPYYVDYYRLPFLKPVLWWYLRLLHNRAELNLCTSQSVHSELTAKRFRNVHVWHRGVDSAQFKPSHRSEAMRIRLTNGEPDKLLLLYVGRLAAEKNIERLKEVLQSSPAYRLALVGDGPHRAALEKHFHGTRTVFTGFLHGDALAEAYASSDVFLFPSSTETLGLVILEAMASGLPVIAVRSGPTSEQVEDGVTGLLFDSERADSLIEAVHRLADTGIRSRMSEQAVEAGARFGWSKASEQLSGFYEEVRMEGRRRRHSKSD